MPPNTHCPHRRDADQPNQPDRDRVLTRTQADRLPGQPEPPVITTTTAPAHTLTPTTEGTVTIHR